MSREGQQTKNRGRIHIANREIPSALPSNLRCNVTTDGKSTPGLTQTRQEAGWG